MFTKILIANRAEIAVRVARTARRMGYATVAVYSEADAESAHVAAADEAVLIGPAAPRESYLAIDALIAAAKRTGAGAIHPGYGFLSENPDFADACARAGIVFIGPPAAAMRAMGSKTAARRLAQSAGVPVTPGYDGEDQSEAALAEAAAAIGFPVMIKAAAGGGGRGMRRVERREDLAGALASARSEAEAAFGDGTLFLERAVADARHVEVQVFGDTHGNVVHLGERDCSIQRRHQKLVEEAPAPGLSSEVRERMGAAAVAAARAAGYVGAGTVEFLFEPASGAFWFMEMNTRLQVEHPVTELVTGLDLVEWQIRVARGEPLPLAQHEIAYRGHAIEARLCAEDPAHGFAPASGPVRLWIPPEGVRVDHALARCDRVPPHYDSMLAKLVAWGATREEARRRLAAALAETVLLGVPTNRGYLAAAIAHPVFVAGRATTGFVAEHLPPAAEHAPDPAALALGAALLYERASPWRGPAEWFNWTSTGVRAKPMRLEWHGRKFDATVEPTGRHAYRVTVAGATVAVALPGERGVRIEAEVEGVRRIVSAVIAEDGIDIALPEGDLRLRDATYDPAAAAATGADGVVRSPMNGRVAAVAVAAGQTVARGDLVVAIEAMKMEHAIEAPVAGRVAEVAVAAGAQVTPGALLARIEPAA
ncbi:MAG: acetyl-CoA carboxylase biotin carboxylase subunit [Burkholderiales bacterium]|nr:acetyl-CoA carboxylase biotin carboxylase subunit [Burkholderiales bacterium]